MDADPNIRNIGSPDGVYNRQHQRNDRYDSRQHSISALSKSLKNDSRNLADLKSKPLPTVPRRNIYFIKIYLQLNLNLVILKMSQM
jgi:hypothetical protein